MDSGDVIAQFSLDRFGEFIQSRNCDPESDKEFFKKNKSKYDKGNLTKEQFWEAYIKATGIKATMNEIESSIKNTIFIDKEMLQILKQVKQKGFKVILVSNIDPTTYEEVLKQMNNADEYFTAMYVSYKIKMLKENPNFFKRILEEQKLNAEECLFVDDLEKNILVAKKLGIQVLLFKNKNSFKEILKQTGFL